MWAQVGVGVGDDQVLGGSQTRDSSGGKPRVLPVGQAATPRGPPPRIGRPSGGGHSGASPVPWGAAGQLTWPVSQWTPSLKPILSPVFSTLVLLAGWATVQVKVSLGHRLEGTVTMLLRE